MNTNHTAQALACVQGPKSPATPLPAAPAIIVIVVLALFTGLTLSGMPVETAGITVGAGGLLGIELVRRLIQLFPHRRTR